MNVSASRLHCILYLFGPRCYRLICEVNGCDPELPCRRRERAIPARPAANFARAGEAFAAGSCSRLEIDTCKTAPSPANQEFDERPLFFRKAAEARRVEQMVSTASATPTDQRIKPWRRLRLDKRANHWVPSEATTMIKKPGG